METEQRIATAKEVLHRLQGRYSRPHSRIHADAALDNATKLRALEGLCGGGCDGLKLDFLHKDGKDRVALRCSKGYSPSALYGNTPPGEKVSCVGYANDAESSERKLTPQEKLGTLRNNLETVGEQMRNFPVDSDQRGFAKLFRKQEGLVREIQELQDSIKLALGYGTTGEYSITSANKPKR